METIRTAPAPTQEEIVHTLLFVRSCQLRAEIESATAEAEEDGEVSFEGFASVGFGDYVSADDARADFVEKLIDDIIDREELYGFDNYHVTDFFCEVLDFADECGYRKEM